MVRYKEPPSYLVVITVFLFIVATIASIFIHSILIAEITLLVVIKIAIPDVTELVVKAISAIFYPDTHSIEEKPHYSEAQTAKNRGDYERALKLYREISSSFPQEVEPYREMIDIARTGLNDELWAEEIFNKGIYILNTTEKKDYLRRFYHNS